MNKISFDDFSDKLKEYTSGMSYDQKIEFYEELLETGSSQLGDGYRAIIFSITNGFEYELIDLEEQNKKAEKLISSAASVLPFVLSCDYQDLKEIDDIVNDDVDDDPIDLSVLQKQAEELEDDYRELTDEELIDAGINPNTKEPIKIDFVIQQLESLQQNSKEMISSDDSDCNIWKDDVIALGYTISVLKGIKDYTGE